MTSPVVIALGSNIPPRRHTIVAGLTDLARLRQTRLDAVSRLHETAPVDGPPGSGPFLNGACLLQTDLSPRELLRETRRIERRHGRRPGPRNAPRPLDLDIVLFGALCLGEADLVVPHPRAHERDFVLVPAAEVAPWMRHPVLGATLSELAHGPPAGEAARRGSA